LSTIGCYNDSLHSLALRSEEFELNLVNQLQILKFLEDIDDLMIFNEHLINYLQRNITFDRLELSDGI